MRGFEVGLFVLMLAACPGRNGKNDAPARFDELERISGPAEQGFGASVAWVRDDLYIGAPWYGSGKVFLRDSLVLEGESADRLGEALAGGDRLRIGSPGRGEGGAVVGSDGSVLYEGQAGDHLGGSPFVWGKETWFLTSEGARSEARTLSVDGMPWSSAVGAFDGSTEQWVLGLVGGGVSWEGGRRAGPVGWGRTLVACDVDQDKDDELVVADAASGEVFVFAIDSLAEFSSAEPTARFSLGRGAGLAIDCFRGGLLVGAPSLAGGGAIAWIRRPLQDDFDDVTWIRGGQGSRLGHAIAVADDKIAIGDPGRGQVRILVPQK